MLLRSSNSQRATWQPFGVLLALVVIAVAVPVAAQNTFPSDCIPPLNSTYAGQFHARYSDGTNVYDLTQPEHHRFTMCTPPPMGGPQNHVFGSEVVAQIAVNGGASMPIQGNANTTVGVQPDGSNGPTRFFDTEMLQLDLVAGPALIRESPTRPSLGRTSITDLGGGTWRIDSFFDVFTELSVDGGQTWMPSTDMQGNPAAGRMQLPGTVASETVSWRRVKSIYKD